MYTTTFEFETEEDMKVLIDLINYTLLNWYAYENKVYIEFETEEDAIDNKDIYLKILEEKEIYVFCSIEDNTETSIINYYEEYGLKESDFY